MLNKKYLFILLIIVAVSKESLAQNIIIRGGINFTSVHTWPAHQLAQGDNNLIAIGYHAGINTNSPLTKKISFETGLIVSKKGYFRDDGEYSSRIRGYVNLLYLDIPLITKFSFVSKSRQYFFGLGPYLGIGLMGDCKMEQLNSPGSAIRYSLVSDYFKWGTGINDYKRIDWGLTLTAGIQYKVMQYSFIISRGYRNIKNVESLNGEKYYNSAFQISVGYKFNLKKK